jgi:hypothetical protein
MQRAKLVGTSKWNKLNESDYYGSNGAGEYFEGEKLFDQFFKMNNSKSESDFLRDNSSTLNQS